MDNKKNGIPKLRFPGFTGAWEQRKLGEIVEWSKGSGLSKDALNIQGIGVPVIHYADLYKFNSVQKEVIHWTMNNIGTKIPENNLLFPMSDVTPDGLARTSTVLQSNVKAGGDVLIAKLNKDILSTFMSYQINRNKNQILPLVTGTTVRHINSKSLSTLKVTVPGKNEQKYVGSILMRFDSLIALHQRKLEHLQEQKKGLLQKMFPKNGETVPEVRFPGFTDAWEQRKLGEVVNFLDTLRKPLEGAKRVKGPYPYYGASGIVDYVDGYLFDEELILLSEDGANITERNYPVCFLASGKYWVNNHAHVLKIKEDNDNNFICNSLERKDYTKYNTGMAMPKLNKETCKGIPIMCPNYDEQKKIGNYFRKFDTLIALHQRKLDHLELMKKGLLQQMFV